MSVRLIKAAAPVSLLALSTGLLSAQITITSPNVLLPASVAVSYEPYGLTGTGGTPPYTWTVIGVGAQGLPPGMTLAASGTISGQPTATGQFTPLIKVTDSVGNSATQQFSLLVAPSAGTLSRTAVLSQVAEGGGWSTSIYLVNTSATVYESATLTFRTDPGSPLFLPITISQQGISQSVSVANWSFTLAPNTTVVIQTTAPATAALEAGWADVFTTGGIGAYALFSESLGNGLTAEGTATSSQFSQSLVLPFNNTNGAVTGAALVSLSANPAVVTATIWSANGTQLGSPQVFDISSLGHSAFEIPTLFPTTAGQQGTIVFTSGNTDAGLAGVGLSFSPLNVFTSVPLLPATM